MPCQCCTPTVTQEPAREAPSVATERPDCGCGCGPKCGCGCRPPSSAATKRHLEEDRRRVSALAPTEA